MRPKVVSFRVPTTGQFSPAVDTDPEGPGPCHEVTLASAVCRRHEAFNQQLALPRLGRWLVRASAMKELLDKRGPAPTPTTGGVDVDSTAADPGMPAESPQDKSGERSTTPPDRSPSPTRAGVTIRVKAIPSTKARDVVKVAVLPLNAASPDVVLELTITAAGGLTGISPETLNLVVLEGLRQLGLYDVEVEEGQGE